MNESTTRSQIISGWVSSGDNRGTFDIVSACVLTMGLCVWSALHLNIPRKGESIVQEWARNLRWMLAGLTGPELVVFSAWRQYASARILRDNLKEIQGKVVPYSNFGKDPRPDPSNKSAPLSSNINSRHSSRQDTMTQIEWTITHGFYAGMGGFVFDVSHEEAPYLPASNGRRTRLTLTPIAIIRLAESGIIPQISEDEIKDKSKSDGVAKALACLQASWMVLQVIGRVGYRLPVTLLEINTIGHVICAFAIYLLWWHKPRFIKQPTVLRGNWVPSVCAFFWMSSRISGTEGLNAWARWTRQAVPKLAKVALVSDAHANDESMLCTAEQTPCCRYETSQDDSEESLSGSPPLTTVSNKPERERMCAIANLKKSSNQALEAFNKMDCMETSREAGIPSHWHQALEAIQTYPQLVEWRVATPVEQANRPARYFEPSELLCIVNGNWLGDGLLLSFRGVWMGMVLWTASMAFGGVHAAAWHGYFPSRLEAELWRFSSVYIMASGAIWITINGLGQWSSRFDRLWERVLAGRGGKVAYVVIGFFCAICGVAYAFARLLLLIEAVISLRQLPAAAFRTPEWSQIIPHL